MQFAVRELRYEWDYPIQREATTKQINAFHRMKLREYENGNNADNDGDEIGFLLYKDKHC